MSFTESEVEKIALSWFSGLGYATLFGPSIAPGEPLARADHQQFAVNKRGARRRALKKNGRLTPGRPS